MGIPFRISLRKFKTGFQCSLRWDVTSHCSVRSQRENDFYSVLRGGLLEERVISETGSFCGKMKRCNLMQITVPLRKGLKLEEICQNIVKVEESNFITLFWEFAKMFRGRNACGRLWSGREMRSSHPKGRLVGPGRPLPWSFLPEPCSGHAGSRGLCLKGSVISVFPGP